VPGDGDKAHLLKEIAKALGFGRGEFHELEAVRAQGVVEQILAHRHIGVHGAVLCPFSLSILTRRAPPRKIRPLRKIARLC
jgi:hypothetical protein